MNRYFYNSELDIVESLDTIQHDYYELFGEDYETFDEYLEACMSYNNGVLTHVSVELKHVKRELNKKLALAQKYGYEEYADELADLLADMDKYSKYVRAERNA